MNVWFAICTIVGYLVIVGAGLSLAVVLVIRLLMLLGKLPWQRWALYVGLVDDIEWGARCPECKTYVEWGDVGFPVEQVRRWVCPGCAKHVVRSAPGAVWEVA